MTRLEWILSIAVGAFLLLFGVTKFTGGAHIFPYIEYKATSFGVPGAGLFFPLVNLATGALEVVAGALVLIPAVRRLGSLVAAVPFLGAFLFHVSPLLGVNVPTGYADPAPTDALSAGGPFLREHFSPDSSPVLFAMASVMLAVAIVNALLVRRNSAA